MATYILGISGLYHDAAAAIIKDGEIIAAAQEERFTRKRHDPSFPSNAINYCLAEAFIESEDVAMVVFYDHPILTFERLANNFLHAGKKGVEQFEAAARAAFGVKWRVKELVGKVLGHDYPAENILFCSHHMSHAASAFYPSPFKDAAVITVDGVGEWQTTTIGKGNDNVLELIKEINYPHSLGLLYSAFTSYCGFKINSGEYKLMGLAPYGQPVYADLIRRELVDVKQDGSFRLNMKYFTFIDSLSTIGAAFEGLFGQPQRLAESRITQHTCNVAASIQEVTEEIMLLLAREAKKITGSGNLCLAGGVALNCVANGKIAQEKIFDRIWIQPAAGDAGGAIGAALFGWYQHFGRSRMESAGDGQKGSLLGPSFSRQEIKAFAERGGFPYREFADPVVRNAEIASFLAAGKVVGYFSGRMEFGPRSLGARSILGDARNRDMQARMNVKIKFRESFRPFAPAVLEEDYDQYFDLEQTSPYMLLVAPVHDRRRMPASPDLHEEDLIKKVNQIRSDIPAVTHVDYSARVQTVSKEAHPDFHQLIQAFKELTGSSVLVNTSFNVRGEPIVCTPKDAYTCFMRTNMDVLVLQDLVFVKEEQPKSTEESAWQQEFQLD